MIGTNAQTLFASMVKMCHHPDLRGLSHFEKLVLALGRWPQFFVLSLVQSGMNSNKFKDEYRITIENWRDLKLDMIEYRFVEILALTGRGKIIEYF